MFNRIESIIQRRITGNFSSLEELVNYIKSDQRAEIDFIRQARQFGKGTDEYDTLKRSKIPCAIINFNHNQYVKTSTIIKPTGYLFLDVDEDDCLGNLDFSYVSAYWKSLSNKGYSFVVKVNGLHPDTLRDSYRYVGDLLDLPFDPNAISKDRLTVLSYDPNAYFSDQSVTIELPNPQSTHYNSKKYFLLGYDYNGDKIRYDNLDEMAIRSGIDIKYNDEGIFDFGANDKLKYAKAIVPFHPVTKGKRNTFLSSFSHQLIALNPNTPNQELSRHIRAVNSSRVKPPLGAKEINHIINTKLKHRHLLTPILNAERRFLYNPEFNLDATEKRRLVIKEVNKGRVENSKNKIRDAIVNWNYDSFSKITIKNLVIVTKMNKKTIQKYYKSIRDELGV